MYKYMYRYIHTYIHTYMHRCITRERGGPTGAFSEKRRIPGAWYSKPGHFVRDSDSDTDSKPEPEPEPEPENCVRDSDPEKIIYEPRSGHHAGDSEPEFSRSGSEPEYYDRHSDSDSAHWSSKYTPGCAGNSDFGAKRQPSIS